jgi:hypothetical protein
MATYPWRFQADLKEGDTNPDVTVFIGDTITNDETGEKIVHQNTADPVIVKLADLASYVETGMANGVTRAKKELIPPIPSLTPEERKEK